MSAKSRDGMPTLPRIGGSSNAQTSNENAQDEAAAEIREQRERVKNSKNKSRGRRRQKPDMYANNPLGASIRRKGKFKGAVYKRRKPKPATKPGKGLTDKRGQFRMFRQRKRTLADLHQAKANVLATIRTMGALAAAGKAGKVRREDAERALKRVMRSVANTGDAEALRQGVKQAQEAGLTPQNGILRKAQRELESLILQQLLRRKMEECDLSRNSADLRKGMVAAVKGGLSKGTVVYTEAMKLLNELDEEEQRTAEALARLATATTASRSEKDISRIQDAIKSCRAFGVPESHDVMQAAQQKLAHLHAVQKLKAQAEQRLRQAIVTARRARKKGSIPHEMIACVDLGLADGPDSSLQEARDLLAELDGEEDRRAALAASLAAATDKARDILDNKVVRPDGKARIREARAILVEALGAIDGQLEPLHEGVVASQAVLDIANAQLQAVADAESALALYLSNSDVNTAPIDVADIAAHTEQALHEHVPDDGTSAAVKRGRRVALQLVEEARGQVAGAIQNALALASDCLARVTSDANVFSQDGNITLQIGTLQAELEETDNELERSVEAHAKWYRKPVDDSGLSAAQKARFSAEVVAPLVKEADSLRLRPSGGGASTGCGILWDCKQDLDSYLQLYVAVLEQKGQLQAVVGTGPDSDAVALGIDTSVLESCLETAKLRLQSKPYAADAFYIREALAVLEAVQVAKVAAQERGAKEAARIRLREAIVKCCCNHDIASMDEAQGAAVHAGVAMDSDDVACAEKLKNELLPKLRVHAAAVSATVQEWEGDDRDDIHASLEAMEGMLAKLDEAIAMRRDQETRGGGRQGPTLETLSLETVCALPNGEESELFDRGEVVAEQMRKQIRALYSGYEQALKALEMDLCNALETAKKDRESFPLREAASRAQKGVQPPVTLPGNLARFHGNTSICEAATRLSAAMKDVSPVVLLITREAEQEVNAACNAVEEDDSAALLLQRALNKHTDNGNLDDSSAAVRRASALLAKLRAATAAVEAIVRKLVTASSAARKSRSLEFLQAAIKSSLSNGLPEKHQAVIAAKELADELKLEAKAKEAAEKARIAAEETLRQVIDAVSQTSDLEVLRSGLEAALVVLDGSNSIVLEANDLAEKIESQRRELEKALATLRQAIVVCSRDHDETKLDKAMQLVEDCSAHDSSMEVVCARKLKNDLLPELATHVDTVRRIVAEWRSDERSSHENSLHWLQKSLDRLESAIAMRVIQEQRAVYLVDNDVNHAAAMLNLENVCVVPSSEEAVLLDDGGDLAQELQAAIDNLHNKYQKAALHLAEQLSESTDQAINNRTSFELQKCLVTAEVGVIPAVSSEDLTVMRQREAVTDAESMLLANIARAQEALLKIKNEASASLESLSNEAEADPSAASALQDALTDQVDVRGNLVNTDACVQRARAILAAIQAGSLHLSKLAERLAEVVAAVQNDREAAKLQMEFASASNDGLPIDHAVAVQAQDLLNELAADEAMLQKLVDEVTISRDAESLDDGIQHARQLLSKNNNVIVAADNLLAQIQEEREATMKAAARRLAEATASVRDSKDTEFLKTEIQLGSKQGVPSNAKEMIEAMDLLSSLDSETQAIVAAQRQLQRVINEVEISQVAGPLESALEQAKEVLSAGDSVVHAGQVLLAQIREAREAYRLALERLVAATTHVKESYETEYLKEELQVALECPLIEEDTDEVSQARTLINEIVQELSARLKAATEAADFFSDIAVLDAELKYCEVVLRHASSSELEIVVEAESKLEYLNNQAHNMAVNVQKHARAFLARKHVEKLRAERDDDINNIFGELGMYRAIESLLKRIES
eukprot:INCI16432.1.p1 GENE.INCI16432.1~~INCI16432.1.p1  ORF type:complete len:1824 (+),score=455.99 INCI16432.1:51-5522(+)